jgi:acyl-CoA thioester hydrolase
VTDPFRVLLRVRYGECDAQQVVFNARYADYVDVAATEYVRALFGSYQALLEQGYDNQVVKLLIEWRSPARFDEVLAVTVQTEKLGNTSYTLLIELAEYHSGRPVARCEAVYVLIDARTQGKLSIPRHLRQQLADGAPGVVVDQAGINPWTDRAPLH